MQIRTNRSRFLKLKRKLNGWTLHGAEKDVDKGVKKLETNYKTLMLQGLNADGSPMKPVTDLTMNSPIRRGGPDKRIRKNVNPSASRPIQATGNSIKSIQGKRKGKNEWEVAPGAGIPQRRFKFNDIKHNRDPWFVSDKQLTIIEGAILDGLDDVLRGI